VGHYSVARPGLTELARVEAILAQMAPEDRALIEPRVLPKSVLRRRRLALRNRLIRDARRQFFGDLLPTLAARAMATALAAYAAAAWRWEKHLAVLPEAVAGRHRALYGIMRAHNGASLGWRRIAEILAPARNRSVLSPGHADTHDQTAAAGR
jgi:hypothetical protein